MRGAEHSHLECDRDESRHREIISPGRLAPDIVRPVGHHHVPHHERCKSGTCKSVNECADAQPCPWKPYNGIEAVYRHWRVHVLDADPGRPQPLAGFDHWLLISEKSVDDIFVGCHSQLIICSLMVNLGGCSLFLR